MAELKPLYLFSGDDSVKLDSVRERIQRRCRQEGWSIEVFEGANCLIEPVISALGSLTFISGPRVVVADGVERWKGKEIDLLAPALKSLAAETSLLLIGRGKVDNKLSRLVKSSSGELHSFAAPKPWELPRWACSQAEALGFKLNLAAAETLVARIGPNQNRLMRELEKFVTAAPAATFGRAEVELFASQSSQSKIFELTDAVLEGDIQKTVAALEELRFQAEDGIYMLTSLVRQVQLHLKARNMIDAGCSGEQIQTALKSPNFVVKRTLARAKKINASQLETILVELAELDYQIKGGSDLDSQTAQTLAVRKAAELALGH